MSVAALPASYFIGWDVGAWNCEQNEANGVAAFVFLHFQVGYEYKEKTR